MSGELILVFLLLLYLRKSLPNFPELKKWERIIQISIYVVPALMVFNITLLATGLSRWLNHLVLLGVIIIASTNADFRAFRNIMIAIVPFALASVTRDIIRYFHGDFSSTLNLYMSIIYPCTIVWMMAMLFIINKQRKVSEQERKRRQHEDEQNKIIAIRKAELETVVAERTSEILAQKVELEQTIAELKETQAQLIQKEKMASLGELTAGIAHEIQNPLNFVNNFSEVNKELLEEMQQELVNGNLEEVKAIALDIKDNEVKIFYHGKRADAIVKGMLQHSRASSGQREPTKINDLADEFLRLSYHGLRAKDKEFNASFKTYFDESIGEMNIVPQEMGRVLLNLFNNAFYSVAEKKKLQLLNYEPTVSITTQKLATSDHTFNVVITVRDNGLGIPPKALDKIYQPFFTTKPSGQGTGLGLSLSYEVIKAHGGELRVETKEGEFAAFIILLPYNGS